VNTQNTPGLSGSGRLKAAGIAIRGAPPAASTYRQYRLAGKERVITDSAESQPQRPAATW
jgi:hypothetical protein